MAAQRVADDEDGFVCGNCQRGRCSRCSDPDCSCCWGGDPEPWPAFGERVLRLLRRLRGPAMPCPA
jgi:hypothetical protein